MKTRFQQRIALLLLAVALCLCGQSAFASVAYVGGATASNSGTAGTSLTVTYSPTAGNQVVLGIMFAAAVTSLSCADQNSNALTLNTHENNAYEFYGTAIAGATSFKCQWTTSAKASEAVAEYSGVVGVGTNGINSGSSTSSSISVTTTKSNSFIVAIFGNGVNATYTATSGNLRQNISGGAGNSNAVAIMDNTAAIAGTSVTDTATVPTGAWNAVGLELYPTQPANGSGQLLLMGVGP
jgi:hypothetical protein